MLEEKATNPNRFLGILIGGWCILCMVGFIGGILSLFPGDKMGEHGYQMVISLAVILFSVCALIFPFLCFITIMDFPFFNKNKKLSKRNKKKQRQWLFRVLLHCIVHIIVFYLALFGLAFIVMEERSTFTVLLGICIWVGIFFLMRKFYTYCRTHKVKIADSYSMIMLGAWILTLALGWGGIYNSYRAIMDSQYLQHPRELTLTSYKIYRGNSFRSKFYYNLDGFDTNGNEVSFKLDYEPAQPFVENKPKLIRVYYLPYTNVVMFIK